MTTAKRRSRSGVTRGLLLVVGISLTAVLVSRVGVRAVLQQLMGVGPEALWLIFPYALGTMIGAFPWQWLLPPFARLRTRALIAGRFAASGANALLPFFGLGGEPARLLWLPAEARPQGMAAIVLDRVLYNSASALFLLLGACAALAGTSLPKVVGEVTFAAGGIVLAITLGLAILVVKLGMGRRIQRLLGAALGSAYLRADFGTRVDAELSALLRGGRQNLWSGLLVHLVGRAVLGYEACLALWVLNLHVGLAQGLVVASVPVATSLVASMIPSQIGVQEASQELVCSLLGYAPGVGIAIVLLQRARQLVFIGVTLAVFGFRREE